MMVVAANPQQGGGGAGGGEPPLVAGGGNERAGAGEAGAGAEGGAAPNGGGGPAALRFEDLTIDDDLPLLDRVVRYCRSGIALQRLVHVKMLAETSRSVGATLTMKKLVPLLPPLVSDPESIIRQHVAAQLLPLCLTCMLEPLSSTKVDAADGDAKGKRSNTKRRYLENGYHLATTTLLSHLNTLITDGDGDVRRAASDSIASLASYVRSEDVAPMILPIPLRLAHDDKLATSKAKDEGGGAQNTAEDLRITAANLLGELASIPDPSHVPPSVVSQFIAPTSLSLCDDANFRVRRAAVQALPRVLGGSSADDAQRRILPAFVQLSRDDMYRVRKAVGECLVDMSRGLMLLPGRVAKNDREREEVTRRALELRRLTLVPVANRLLGDANKFVRHGMMQFLGPLIASFYPLDRSAGNTKDVDKLGLGSILGVDDLTGVSGGAAECGGAGGAGGAGGGAGAMGPQFFPHADGMVNRMNSAASTDASSQLPPPPDENADEDAAAGSGGDAQEEKLRALLPSFLQSYHADALALETVVSHRASLTTNPLLLSDEDLDVVQSALLPHFVAMANVSTGDDNVDAEMRVYCAYSLPAVVLLLGKEGWTKHGLRECFFALVHGGVVSVDDILAHGSGGGGGAPGDDEEVEDQAQQQPLHVPPAPLPVKRCLASSIHTVSHILGSELTSQPEVLTVFERHFLRDADETVRLNVVRNLASFLSLLSSKKRARYLPILHEIVMGDAVLGATVKRSASNPTLLNWRQRDVVAQCLPNLIVLFDAPSVRTYIWPMVQMLLGDTVSAVREDAEWSLPVLLRMYAPINVGRSASKSSGGGHHHKHSGRKSPSPSTMAESETWSKDACTEVISWLKTTLLVGDHAYRGPRASNLGAFSKRQDFLRICADVALALRLESYGDLSQNESFQRLVHSSSSLVEEGDEEDMGGKGSRHGEQATRAVLTHNPFYRVTPAEYRHLHRILTDELIPSVLDMKEDRVTNVRLAVVKCLRVMPDDIRNLDDVQTVVATLEEEMHTWEGGDGFYEGIDPPESNYNPAASVRSSAASAAPSPPQPTSSATTTRPSDPPRDGGDEGSGSSADAAATSADRSDAPSTESSTSSSIATTPSKDRRDDPPIEPPIGTLTSIQVDDDGNQLSSKVKAKIAEYEARLSPSSSADAEDEDVVVDPPPPPPDHAKGGGPSSPAGLASI